MADYYPLLAKAVAGLPNSTPESRRAIYERARTALFGQLRKLDPPIPETDVERESRALEAAVSKLEAELEAAAPSLDPVPLPTDALPDPEGSVARTEASGSGSAAEPPEPKTPFLDPGAPDPRPAAAPASPPRTTRPSSLLLKARRDGSAQQTSDSKAAGETNAGAVPTPPPFSSRRSKKALNRPEDAEKPSGTEGLGATPLPAQESPAKDFFAQDPFAEEAVFLGPVTQTSAAEAPEAQGASSGETPEPAIRTRPGAHRPHAPQPVREAAAPKRHWIVWSVAGLLVMLLAIGAYKLRDRPEDVLQKVALAPALPEAAPSGKIVERIGAGADSSPARAGDAGSEANRIEAAKNGAEPGNPALRAALLVAAPEEQSKVKTFLGSVVWRVDNVSNGPGEALSMAVRAEIDIPEEKLQAVMTLQKNLDSTLPASHTMNLRFLAPPDGPLGNIQQINVPQMRREDTATGSPLSGIPVPIMENSFLVGLSRGNAEAANLDLLRAREWIDIPMVLSDGRIAKLTFEKGAQGQRALEDAIASWQAQ